MSLYLLRNLVLCLADEDRPVAKDPWGELSSGGIYMPQIRQKADHYCWGIVYNRSVHVTEVELGDRVAWPFFEGGIIFTQEGHRVVCLTEDQIAVRLARPEELQNEMIDNMEPA